jgi:hypothetical protein
VTVTPINALGNTFDVKTYDFSGNPPGGGGSIGGSGTTTLPPGPTSPMPSAARASVTVRSLRLTKRGLVAVPLSCQATQTCNGTLSLATAKPVKVSRKRIVKLGSAKFSIPGGRVTKVHVRLSKKNVRLIRRLKSVRAKASVKPSKGAALTATTRTIKLKAR